MIDDPTGTSWWFAPLQAGTMPSSGLSTLLEGAHLERPEMFVREVVQNSVDARLDTRTEPVRVCFSSYELTPSQSEHLGAFLAGDGELARRLPTLRSEREFPADGGFFLRWHRRGDPTRVLLVEDFETKGLGGRLGGRGEDDHFSRLVYIFGQSHGDGGTGGAFGFGKSVYSIASQVRTVIYYSRPADEGESRLIAVSLFPAHEYQGTEYRGYALCGLPSDDVNFPIRPVTGDAADSLARAIGMTPRSNEETGTSLMVLDCDYAASELADAVEKWWWPRLLATGPEGLKVEISQDGRAATSPNPRGRPELEGFVQAYEHFLDGRADTTDTRSKTIKSTGQRVVGRVVLRRIEVQDDEPETDTWHSHRIALVRGPRLVVQYEPFGRQHKTPFVGVFVADYSIDPVIRRSENPAHDTWASESNRLEDNERAYVRAVNTYCKRFANDFQSAFEAKPLDSTSRLRALENLLGRLFRKGNAAGPVPKGAERPIHLHVKERRLEEGTVGEARIEILPKHSPDKILARLQVSAHLLGDANRAHLDWLPVTLMDEDGQVLATAAHVEHPFELEPDGAARFVARATSTQDSLIRFSVTVSGRAS